MSTKQYEYTVIQASDNPKCIDPLDHWRWELEMLNDSGDDGWHLTAVVDQSAAGLIAKDYYMARLLPDNGDDLRALHATVVKMQDTPGGTVEMDDLIAERQRILERLEAKS